MFFLSKVDYFLDRITMYRLMLYILIFLVGASVLLGFLNLIPFSPLEILISASVFILSCYVSNKILSKLLKAPTNLESVYITSLILTLIISPTTSIQGLGTFVLVGVIAMVSKYILAINKKHIFNPVGIAVVIAALVGFQSASWWVGTTVMAPFILICGLLVVRKIRYEYLVWAFLVVYLVFTIGLGIASGINPFELSKQVILNSHLLFFAFIMLTEPLTLPPTRNLKILYGALIGVLTVPQIHIGNIYLAPEQVLVIGNIASFIFSPKQKLMLEVARKTKISKDAMEFVFSPVKKFNYKPGQYMEWTLSHKNPDNRGTRRFFTIASSPTEESIRLGINFIGEKGSSFKKKLEKGNGEIVASSLSGEFTLPKNSETKLVFIAGGIGITPFRSMIKYLVDKNEKRDIVLIYSNTSEDEITYRELFDFARNKLGIKIVYTLSGESLSSSWVGSKGRINEKMIKEEVPDYKDRVFYISGSQPLTNSVKSTLKSLGVRNNAIKTDYFPGLT